MRKLISILVLLFTVNLLSAQEFNKWSIEPEFGLTKVRDLTPVKFYNTGIGGRYMVTQYFGVKVSSHFTDIPYNDNADLKFVSGKIMGVANFGRLAKLERVWNNRWTILGGVGGDYTDSRGSTNDVILHRTSDFHLAGFVNNEFRITDKFFVTTILNLKTGVNSRPNVTSVNRTMTTSILDFNVGLVFVLGKNKVHADYYLEPEVTPICYVYIDSTKNITNVYNNYNNEVKTIEDKSPEYVYFNNDSYKIDKDGLENIEQSLHKVKDKIVITAYCSNIASSEYNLKLAQNRGNAVKDKLVKLGVDAAKIEVVSVGIDASREYDMARRVKIEFK